MADGLSHRLGTRALLRLEPCLTLEHCMLARGAAGPASVAGEGGALEPQCRTVHWYRLSTMVSRFESMRKLVTLLGYTVVA